VSLNMGNQALLSGEVLKVVIGSLILLGCSPMFALVLVHANINLEGSWLALWHRIVAAGFFGAMNEAIPAWSEIFVGVQVAAVFLVLQMAIMWLMPGNMHTGPIAPSGHVPVYKANGVQAFLFTIFLWAAGAHLGFFKAGFIYDIFAPFIAACNVIALALCVILYFKGRFAPSTPDAGHTGNLAFDIFWGTELYPRFGHSLWAVGFDVKLLTNCRFGMMFWGVGVLSLAAKQYELYGFVSSSMLVSAAIQVVYVLKFFLWEMGYMCTMDIQHDRAGFYICWGCMVWVPSMYTCHTLFLTNHPYALGTPLTVFLLLLGVASVYINYDADRQKTTFRESKGKCTIWGKPARKIEAQYLTSTGAKKTSLLLLSGWWGVSRHFHYVPELMAAFVWCAPTLWEGSLAGFTYFIFLSILLTDRSFRDDARCRSKYGDYWTQYCAAVPYKIVPYLL